MSKSLMDRIAESYIVRVTKNKDDGRKSLCGSKFIDPRNADHDGELLDGEKRPYCFVPVHVVDGLKTQFRHYNFGEPFIPAEVKKK